jgi:hypothetical protein
MKSNNKKIGEKLTKEIVISRNLKNNTGNGIYSNIGGTEILESM